MVKETHQRRQRRRRLPPSPSSTSPEQSYEGQDDDPSFPASLRRSQSNEDEVVDDEFDPSGVTETQSVYSGADPSRPTTATEASVTSACSSSSALPTAPPETPSVPTYISVAPLPIFRGSPGECPVSHLSRFARVCRANNASTADMVARIFPVTLDGEAAMWYELTVEPDPSLSWDEVRSLFLQAYRRVDQSRAELLSLRQAEEEGVNAFYLRMRWILRKWPDHGIPDEMLRGIFIDGLRDEFQDWVVPQRPNSLDEAFRLALAWEQAQSVRRRRNGGGGGGGGGDGVGGNCRFCDGTHEESVCGVRRGMRELWVKSRDEGLSLGFKKEGGGGGDGGFVGKGGGLRSLTTSGSVVRRKGEEERGGGDLSSTRRSQCMCWKHQCWKKFERSTSFPVDRSPAADQ